MEATKKIQQPSLYHMKGFGIPWSRFEEKEEIICLGKNNFSFEDTSYNQMYDFLQYRQICPTRVFFCLLIQQTCEHPIMFIYSDSCIL